MKKLTKLLTLTVLLVSCGQTKVRFSTADQARFNEIEDRVDAIERQLADLVDQMDLIGYKLSSLESTFSDKLQDVYNQLKFEINQHNTSVSGQIDDLEDAINNLADGTLEILDPCKQNNFNEEILLKKGSGELIALYYTGSKAFLTKLKDGNYITTDFRSCRFTIANGQLQ